MQSYILDNFSGGVNLRGEPLAIDKTDLLNCLNMYPVAAGHLVGRAGQVRYTANEIVGGTPVKSLYKFYKTNGQGIQLATLGSFVFRCDDVTGFGTPIDSGYATGRRFSFTTWTTKDKVYWTNGINFLKSFDGTTVVQVPGSPPIGSQVEMYLERLYVLRQNTVGFSDLGVDNVWPGAAVLNISDNRGGMGSFLKAANRVLIAGKTSGLWRLEGSPLLGNTFIEYSNVGCVSPWTADIVTVVSSGQVVPVGVIFGGSDGIYITDGFTVRQITPKIDPLFTAYFRDAVGKYYPKKRQYYFSFNSAGGANNTLWVGTNLDISGSRVAWTPYNNHACDSFSVWDGGSDNGELLAGRSDNGHINKLDVGDNDIGVPYMAAFNTRYLGDPAINKQVRWLKPVFDAQNPVSFNIDYFQKQFTSGPVVFDMSAALIWDTGQWDVNSWGGPSINSARTSVIDGRYGRYLSVGFQNTGDGPAFRFFQLEIEARIKDHRVHDLFTLNYAP